MLACRSRDTSQPKFPASLPAFVVTQKSQALPQDFLGDLWLSAGPCAASCLSLLPGFALPLPDLTRAALGMGRSCSYGAARHGPHTPSPLQNPIASSTSAHLGYLGGDVHPNL